MVEVVAAAFLMGLLDKCLIVIVSLIMMNCNANIT